MKDYFFTLNKKCYSVKFHQDRIEVTRLENGQLKELTSDEQKEIEKVIHPNRGFIYYSDRLTGLIENNNQIDNKEFLTPYLNLLEQAIPDQLLETFYNNVKTLKTSLGLNIDFQQPVSTKEVGTSGEYNIPENTINIYDDAVRRKWDIAQSAANPQQFFWNYYSGTLIHELTHMASSHYDKEEKICYCGFDKIPPLSENDRNRGLTEGFTELFALLLVPGTSEKASDYFVETSFVLQMASLIGFEPLCNCYFANLGIAPLEQEMSKWLPNPNQVSELFRSIELNFNLTGRPGPQNILGNIQATLLTGLETKCEQLEFMGCDKEIKPLLTTYGTAFITEDKLKFINRDPDDYIGLRESQARWNALCTKYGFVHDNEQEKSSMK